MNISIASCPLHAPADAGRPPRKPSMRLPGVGSLPELVRLMGLPAADDADTGAMPPELPVLRVQPDGVLMHEGAPARSLYVVRSGSFKCVRTQEDGYEQVLTLAQTGELVGVEALHGGSCHSSAIALEDATVYALSAAGLQGLQQRCPLLEEALRHGLSRQLSRAAETAEMMAAVAAEVRLARFVLWISARMAEIGQSPLQLRLRMARRDIASMLGVAHETVSRTFSALSDAGLLRVNNREVRITDLAGLRARARCTRRPLAEAGSDAAHDAEHDRPHPATHGQPVGAVACSPAPVPPGWWSGAASARPC